MSYQIGGVNVTPIAYGNISASNGDATNGYGNWSYNWSSAGVCVVSLQNPPGYTISTSYMICQITTNSSQRPSIQVDLSSSTAISYTIVTRQGLSGGGDGTNTSFSFVVHGTLI